LVAQAAAAAAWPIPRTKRLEEWREAAAVAQSNTKIGYHENEGKRAVKAQ